MLIKHILLQSFQSLSILIFTFLILVNLVQCNQPEPESTPTSPTIKEFKNSHSSLAALAFHEESIYNALKDSGESFEDLTRYLTDYEDSISSLKMNENEMRHIKIADNPLSTFQLMHRFVIDLKKVLIHFSTVKGLNVDSINAAVLNVQETTGWPNTSSLEMVMDGILRIHHVYDARILEYAKGNIFGTETGVKLHAKHCYEIGKYAIQQKYYSYAVDWLEYAHVLVAQDDDQTLQPIWTYEWWTFAIKMHDVEWNRHPSYEPMFFVQPLESVAYPRFKRRDLQVYQFQGKRAPEFNIINFWSLCSGADLRTEEERLELFCWYDRKSNPAWFISPLKIEQLSKTPDLIQIYEVLTNSLMEKLIQQAEPDLGGSGLYHKDGNKMTKERTSLNSWIREHEIEDLKSIPRRLELITGLTLRPYSASERIQVATYTFGGHYELKTETGYWATVMGDRIATFMIYLSDVEQGGYTAFPQAGIAVKPVKGSAVFWYNFLKNGEPNENSNHGACPVILGSKWVANKWIRSNDQMFNRPCSLNSYE